MAFFDTEKGAVARLPKGRAVLPPGYAPLAEPPFDIHGSQDAAGFLAETGEAICAIVLTPTPLEQAMPYNDPQRVIDFCKDSLGENQGIVEVDTGRTNGGYRYLYSIVKTRLEEEGSPIPIVTYTLNMDVDYRDFTLNLLGMFQGDGTTGVRESIAHELVRRAIDLEPGDSRWSRDPYDPDTTRGFLMNLAELPVFDGIVPGHPLSQARRLVRFFSEHN